MTSVTTFTHDHVEITVKVTGDGYCDWNYWFTQWLEFFHIFLFKEKTE